MLSAPCDLSNRLPMNRFPLMRQPLPHCKQNKTKQNDAKRKLCFQNSFFESYIFKFDHVSHSHTYFCRCVWDLLLMAFFCGIHRRHSWQWPLHRCHCRNCYVLFRHCFLAHARRCNFSAFHWLCAPHSIDRRVWTLFDLVNQLHDRSRWFDRYWLALHQIRLKIRLMVVAVGHSQLMELNWLAKGLWRPWHRVGLYQADGHASYVFAKCCCAMWSNGRHSAWSCWCCCCRRCRWYHLCQCHRQC